MSDRELTGPTPSFLAGSASRIAGGSLGTPAAITTEPSSPARAFETQQEVDRLLLALAGIDPASEIARWVGELRAMHEGNGMATVDAQRVSYRQGRVGELLIEGVTNQEEIARRVGCSKRTVEGDIAALRRLLAARRRGRRRSNSRGVGSATPAEEAA